jgi:hypothetical protein
MGAAAVTAMDIAVRPVLVRTGATKLAATLSLHSETKAMGLGERGTRTSIIKELVNSTVVDMVVAGAREEITRTEAAQPTTDIIKIRVKATGKAGKAGMAMAMINGITVAMVEDESGWKLATCQTIAS